MTEHATIATSLAALLRSRKFLLALAAVIQTLVLYYIAVPAEVWASINALIIVVIGGIAYEDGQEKSASTTVAAGQVETLNAER